MPKPSAIVTGGGSGIGAAMAATLAASGYAVTVLDLNAQGANSTRDKILQSGGTSSAAELNVSNPQAQRQAFEAHVARFGQPSAVVLSAGIGDKGMASLLDSSDESWRNTIDVNLTALVDGSKLALKHMAPGGSLLLLASAGGIFPMPFQPVYSASKAAVVQFARSIGKESWDTRRVRVSAICPQFVDTPMVDRLKKAAPTQAKAAFSAVGGKIIEVDTVVQVMMGVVERPAEAPAAILIMADGTISPYPPPRPGSTKHVSTSPGKVLPPLAHDLKAWAIQPLPGQMNSVEVYKLSDDFRAATRIAKRDLPPSSKLPRGSIIIRRLYTGVNASDVNFSAGRYMGSPKEAEKQLPFDAGFESVGVVVAVGPEVKGLSPGQPVATVTYGGFSDYAVAKAAHVMPVSEASPAVVAMLTSGLTASIGLEQAGRMRSGETVMVTAAAGGTGQFAVQLAKAAGNRVIGTCGGPKKAELLRSLGVDRVIDYNKEDVKNVLRKEFPKGIDIIYESVGGEMFQTCLKALARNGRLVVIGMMSQYGKGWPASSYPGLCEALLWKSATCQGFFLPHFAKHFQRHLEQLMHMHHAGKLHIAIDSHEFRGLESVADAVELLQSGKSQGKVVVNIAAHPGSKQHAVASKL